MASWLSMFENKTIEETTNNESKGENETVTGGAENQSSSANDIKPLESETVNNTDDLGADLHYDKKNIVAKWAVPMKGQLYKVEFEHGTTTGKRVIWVNQKVLLRRDWMFKLVGDDVFHLEGVRCVLRVNPAPGFKYQYILFVDEKPLEQFKEKQAKALRTWEKTVGDTHYRVVLEKDTLNIFLNGDVREEEAEFVDVGTETRWISDDNIFVLTARTSGNKRDGIVHDLTINGTLVEEMSIGN